MNHTRYADGSSGPATWAAVRGPRHVLIALALVPLAAVLLAAAGATLVARGTAGNTGASAGVSGTSDQVRLWIKGEEGLLPVDGTREVAVNGVVVDVSVAANPLGRGANLDLFVTRDGVPVADASVALQYDMMVMQHGPFELLAVQTGHGHFLAPLALPMSGEFWLDVEVHTSDATARLHMIGRATR